MTTTAPANHYDPAQILALPMDPDRNDARASTVRDYLVTLLATLWREEANFSGKRPFGSSSWTAELITPLIKAGVIAGKLDEEEGWIDECDDDAGDAAIAAAIEGLRGDQAGE